MKAQSLVTGLRSVELGVTDLERSTRFYTEAWGLSLVSSTADMRCFRAGGGEHHVLALRQMAVPCLMGVTLAARDREAALVVCERLSRQGLGQASGVMALASELGGGYGVVLEGAEGLRVTLSWGSDRHAVPAGDASVPANLTHVVINTPRIDRHLAFFVEGLGFAVSDSTHIMEFMHCGSDHHTLALARGDSLSLNHAAFEMRDIDSLMYGAGRVIEQGHAIEWGLGRHGPGANVFAYFVDPDGFAVEYTTEMLQVHEGRHLPRDAAYWAEFPRRPCRWGVARRPSDRAMAAMSGRFQLQGEEVTRESREAG